MLTCIYIYLYPYPLTYKCSSISCTLDCSIIIPLCR